jgi:serine/threonine-protein kinase
MSLESGTVLGRYEIRSLLGAGGMGEVYLARDTELERTVALKVLPAEVASDQQRMLRFVQEARAASALNHPNIITIHEIGRTESAPFIATEYINGVTLRQRLTDGRMPVKEALEIAAQVAGALTTAHLAGIVHRDIKPENIMVRPDGYVKVLDFGLAKLTEGSITDGSDPDAATLAMINTTPGAIMGTIKYMSPEQARGLRINEQTDIWSLGVVLYEMLTGRLPFEGPTASDILVAILERAPAPLLPQRPEVPAALAELITQALCKKTADRCRTTAEMRERLNEIKRELDFRDSLNSLAQASPDAAATMLSESGNGLSANRHSSSFAEPGRVAAANSSASSRSSQAAPRKRRSSRQKAIDSLAILPFVNVSDNPETEYLSDGITESIINSLAQLPKLKVMARSTVFRYKGRDQDPQEIGHTLGVKVVLTGRIHTLGDRLIISTELVDVADGTQRWGEKYNRQFADIFSVQDEIAQEISEKLRLKLSGEEQKRLTKRHTDNIEAYQLYLKGRYFWNKRTQEGLRKGMDFFRQAIDLDQNYALAYAGLADSYSFLGLHRVVPPSEILPQAKAVSLKALEIDDSLAEAHTSLAYVKMIYDWDWTGTEQEYKRSLKLNPNDASTHSYYAQFLSAMGRHDEAIREIKRAQELDPLSSIINALVAYMYLLARRYEETAEQIRKTLALDPDFFWIHTGLGWLCEQQGRYREAIAAHQRAVQLTKGSMGTLAALGRAHALAGEVDAAQKILRDLLDGGGQPYVVPFDIATIYAGLGEVDEAFAWLEKAFAARYGWLIWLNIEPRWDSLRADPRFTDLVGRIGLLNPAPLPQSVH